MLWKWCIDDIEISLGDAKEAKRLFQKIQFHNVSIEKARIKRPKNTGLLHKLPFYGELNTLEISKEFKGCARSFNSEIIDLKDTVAQIEANKSSIKYIFKDCWDEIKGFKYQITVKILLSKHKVNADIAFFFCLFQFYS